MPRKTTEKKGKVEERPVLTSKKSRSGISIFLIIPELIEVTIDDVLPSESYLNSLR